MVPVAGGVQIPFWRRVERVIGAGRCETAVAIGMTFVVEELVLWRAPVDRVVLLGAAVEDAGVALRGELPVELQVEVAVLVGADDVVGWLALRQGAVLDVPFRRQALALVAAPAGGGGSVEKELPAGLLLRVGERVGRGGGLAGLLLALRGRDGEEERRGRDGECKWTTVHWRGVKVRLSWPRWRDVARPLHAPAVGGRQRLSGLLRVHRGDEALRVIGPEALEQLLA